MSVHHLRGGSPYRHPTHRAIWAVAAAIIVLAVGACSNTASVGTPAAAVAATSIGPAGQKPTLTGSGSTFDAPFFAVALAKYQQQHPGVTIGYSAVGSSAGIAAISAQQVDFGAADVPMTATEQTAAKGGPITQVPVDPSSYPISGYSWALVYTHQQNQATGQALVTMLDWLTHDGQAHAAANGYVPLPPQIQQLAHTMLQQITGPTGTPILS